MDIFVEQLITKRKTPMENLLIVLIILVTIAICIFSLVWLPQLLPILSFLNILIVAGAIYGAYRLICKFNIEYEYSVTNGDITIDKIFSKRNRKKVSSFDAKTCSQMGKYLSSEHEQRAYDKIIDVSKNIKSDDNWYMVFSNTVLIFSPDERTLTAIKKFLPPSVEKKTFGVVTRKG